MYFSVNSFSKTRRAMPAVGKNTCSLKLNRCIVHLIHLNDYLSSFPGATVDDKSGVTELN